MENIEKFALTSDVMFEYLLDGFGDFSDYDCLHFNGKNIDTVLIERTEDEGYKHILHFESGGTYTDYYFENMNEFSRTLFENMKRITDKKQVEYEQLFSCKFVSSERPNFFDSPFFYIDDNGWHLKEDAPKATAEEFKQYMNKTEKSCG